MKSVLTFLCCFDKIISLNKGKNMENKGEKLIFDNEEELSKYFTKIMETDVFIILVHQRNNFRDYIFDSEPQKKLCSIMKDGLSASRYGSIDGTVNRMGSSKDKSTIDEVLKYDYHGTKKCHCLPTVVLALPRFIDVNGTKTEFVMSNYLKEKDCSQEEFSKLFKEKYSRVFTPDSQHTPKCWADVLKGFKNFNVCDNLCAFYPMEDGKYCLLLPHIHWSEKSKEDFLAYKDRISKKIASYDCSLEDAIIREQRKQQSYINSLYDSID